jgi:hypothetical protein
MANIGHLVIQTELATKAALSLKCFLLIKEALNSNMLTTTAKTVI